MPPTLFLLGRQGVSDHALCGGQRTRSTFRDGDSLLSCKGNRLGRLGLPDRLSFSKPKVNWLLHIMWTRHGSYSFLARFFVQRYNFFCRYAIFFAYLQQKSMIYGYIRVSSDKQTSRYAQAMRGCFASALCARFARQLQYRTRASVRTIKRSLRSLSGM